jgi:hypothetical protein
MQGAVQPLAQLHFYMSQAVAWFAVSTLVLLQSTACSLPCMTREVITAGTAPAFDAALATDGTTF